MRSIPSSSLVVGNASPMPWPAKRSLILPTAVTGNVRCGQLVEQRLAWRRHRVVVPIRRALERARATHERPGDDAARDPGPRPPARRRSRTIRRAAKSGRRLRARRSETRCRPTCRRSAHPVRTCSAPSSSMIAVPDATTFPRRRPPDALLERGDQTPAETRPETSGNGAIEHEAHQLPVAGHRVLAGRSLGHAAKGAKRRRRGRHAGERRRHARGRARPASGSSAATCAGDVAERVAAFVAVQTRHRAARRRRRCRGR